LSIIYARQIIVIVIFTSTVTFSLFNHLISQFCLFLKSYFFIYVQKESDVLDFLNDVREIFRSECDSQVWMEALMRPMARALALIGILPSFAGGYGRVMLHNGGSWNAYVTKRIGFYEFSLQIKTSIIQKMT
jgi:formate hydrogenlyase subunit 3/multisubunit Na+/H+ antiporter MnhD subunit